jgi:hypothetical protein
MFDNTQLQQHHTQAQVHQQPAHQYSDIQKQDDVIDVDAGCTDVGAAVVASVRAAAAKAIAAAMARGRSASAGE